MAMQPFEQRTLANLENKMERIEQYFERKCKRLDDEEGDENKERGNWSGRFDFFLSCLGYAVGLGNVWRFPYLCYRNGGGAFLIPYVIMLAIVGVPIFLLELSLGQFASAGPVTCWKYAPLFTGVGYGMFIVSALVSIYYNMIIGWACYYLFASFTSTLPWDKCGDWSTNLCFDKIHILNTTGGDTCELAGARTKNQTWYSNQVWGTCHTSSTFEKSNVVGFINKTLANEYGIKRELPSQEYFDFVATGSGFSAGIQDLQEPRWQMVLCYLLAFIFVVLALSKSIKTSGKVVYFTATFPYVVLIILLIRGVMLDNYLEGIKFYITPDLERLRDSGVWKDAAVQIFFSLSASWGGLIALASYNKFHNNCVRDTLTVAFGNCLTSVFAGFVIFSYLGYLSKLIDVPVSEVAKSGPSLTFVVYPFAVTTLPAAPFWAILFFMMLITLGVDSEFVLVETVITSLLDRFPKLRQYKLLTVISVSAVFFLLGLTMTTNGGIYMLEVMDTYSGGWNILVIAICECISIGWIYGVRRFMNDIECMVGKDFAFMVLKYWWALCWCLLTPLLCAAIIIFSWVDYKSMGAGDNGDKFPVFADVLGWLMTLLVIVCIVVTAIYQLAITPGSFAERFRKTCTPTPEWGPALVKHREECATYTVAEGYDHSFVVDPWNAAPVSKKSELPMTTLGGIPNVGYVPCQDMQYKPKMTQKGGYSNDGFEARL
ncbi:sodium- and chloride-dependent neutral and basic amino acid transporter B(0+)-like isoform X1 [Argopecten irradians]|uniref:sodium- and chloride-dependent neutral and basic amino acid transporter B(0+)-like isoform X1 n=1 Tax=Argopecten irradians TaxID=31199 RepID=UPI003715BDFC